MKHYFLILSTLLVLVACKKNASEDEGDYAYLGGEIINPINDFVVLSNSDGMMDTITLDQNNRFIHKFTNLKPGLYSFNLQSSMGPEFQMALLEPNDSIMFRLNTIDFDESLVYTGNGAKKNNYLINMFLESEVESEEVFKLSQLSPETFEERLDSIRVIKNKKLQTFESKFGSTDLFREIAQAYIDYTYYSAKEIYPFVYYGNNELKNLESLPDDFYAYRDHLDYNNDLLKDYFPYYTFLRLHFNNVALTEHFKHSNDTYFNRKSLCYNMDKVNLIDSLMTNEFLKNSLLYYNVIRYVNYSENIEGCNKLVKLFLNKSTNENNKEQLVHLTESLKKLRPGNEFPNIKVNDFNNSEFEILSLINKPTVVYFWTYSMKGHFIESHKKIDQLKVKYPEFNFIGINIGKDKPDHWKSILNQYRIPLTNEYQFIDCDKARESLGLNTISKVMVLNRNGKIAIGNANIFDMNFEEQLLGLINK